VRSLERANPTPREGGGVPLDDRRRCGAGPEALDLWRGPLAIVLAKQVSLLSTDSVESPPLSGRGVGAGGTSTTGPPLGPSFFRSPASRLPPLALLRQRQPFSSRSRGGPAVFAAPSIRKRAAARRCQPSGPPPSLPRAFRRANPIETPHPGSTGGPTPYGIPRGSPSGARRRWPRALGRSRGALVPPACGPSCSVRSGKRKSRHRHDSYASS